MVTKEFRNRLETRIIQLSESSDTLDGINIDLLYDPDTLIEYYIDLKPLDRFYLFMVMNRAKPLDYIALCALVEYDAYVFSDDNFSGWMKESNSKLPNHRRFTDDEVLLKALEICNFKYGSRIYWESIPEDEVGFVSE